MRDLAGLVVPVDQGRAPGWDDCELRALTRQQNALLAAAPQPTGQAVCDATLAGYTATGDAQAHAANRLVRAN